MKVCGKTDPLEYCVECGLKNIVIGDHFQYDFRYLFALCKVNNLHLTTINRIPKQQNLKVRRGGILVDTAFGDVHV